MLTKVEQVDDAQKAICAIYYDELYPLQVDIDTIIKVRYTLAYLQISCSSLNNVHNEQKKVPKCTTLLETEDIYQVVNEGRFSVHLYMMAICR